MSNIFLDHETLFSKPGPKNTDAVLKIVNLRARELEIGKVLVPSTTGRTDLNAREVLGLGIKIISVTHAMGFLRPDFQEMSNEARHKL